MCYKHCLQAIEIFAAPEQTIGFTAHFSPNGQWFNQSVTSGNLADSSRDSVKNFSYPAKFVQVRFVLWHIFNDLVARFS